MGRARMRVGLIGSSQVEHIAKLLEGDCEIVYGPTVVRNPFAWGIRLVPFLMKVDVVYWIFVIRRPVVYRIIKLLKKRLVLHWIGSDVQNALQEPERFRKIAGMASVNLVCYEGLQKELASIGIAAAVVPIVPFSINLDLAGVPESHAVLVYMPTGREELYGYDRIKKVAEAFPELPFYIVANDDWELFGLPNIKVMGKLSHEDMDELYDSISIVLRNTRHDGYSMSVIEGLAKGKEVIWNHEHSQTHYADSVEEICACIDEIIATNPAPNRKGSAFVQQNLSFSSVKKILEENLSGCY